MDCTPAQHDFAKECIFAPALTKLAAPRTVRHHAEWSTAMITEGETRGELSQVAFADRLTTQRAQTLSTGISPVHHDEFHMRPPPEKLVAYNFCSRGGP